jgi:gliding motility-associated-like protein
MKKLLLLIFVFTLGLQGWAQMTVDNSLTVEQYVQQVLLGDNVTVSNITYNGGSAGVTSASVGGFDCPTCNMSIPSGFLMTTGDAQGAVGPNDESSHTGTGTGGWDGQDQDLIDLVQAATTPDNIYNDWVIIEFDFIPLGDTLRFNYIWGSEEYDQYTTPGTAYNDVFGFFISGPGISGPYSNNAENIAVIPGTSTAVGIGTLNNGVGNNGPCLNCEYYNQDCEPDGWPWPSDPTLDWYVDPYYMEYDGYTDVLTAVAIVQCGETYHIKLAVCDGSDPSLDSGVFLQRDSFSSNLVVQASLELDVAGPDGNTLFENCGDGNIVFARPVSGDANTTLVAYLGYSGAAINGVDYTLLPDSVVFEPGVMEVSIFLDAFADGLNEGIEDVHIEIENIADCGEDLLSSNFDFFIADIPEPMVVEGFDVEICNGATTTLEPIITGGYAAYHYDWSTGESTLSIDVTPPVSNSFFVTVSDTCGMPSDDAQFIVTVLQTPVMTLDLVDQDNILPMTCDFWGGNIYAIGTGGIEPYTFTFTDDNGNTLWPTGNMLYVSPWNAGMVYVEMNDQCDFSISDSIEIEVDAPELFLNVVPTVNAPCGQPYTIDAQASGGYITWDYSYSWEVNGIPDWTQWTNPFNGIANEPSVVTVNVSDQCGQTVSADIIVTIDSPAIELTLQDNYEGNCTTVFDMIPELAGGSGWSADWAHVWSNDGAIIGTGTTLSSSFAESTVVELTVTDVCGQSATDQTIVTIINPEITTNIGPDINASCLTDNALIGDYEGGSGGVTYNWSVNGDPVASTQNYNLQTYQTAQVSLRVQDLCGESASDTLTIFIPDIPMTLIAAADTAICPGDSVNIWVIAGGGEGGFVYDWTNGMFAPQFTEFLETSQVYSVTVNDICDRTLTQTIEVAVLPIEASFNVLNLGENVYSFEAAPIPVCPECLIEWEFGDGASGTDHFMTHEYDGLEEYTVTMRVTNEAGCTDHGTYDIIPPPLFYIPTAFTPNGDGVNDVFQVVASSVLEYEMHIFNRWGDEVFTSTDPNEVWVGETKEDGEYYVANGSYNFVARIKGFNSETYKLKGAIQMIR